MSTSKRLTTWRTLLGKGTDSRLRRSRHRRSGPLAAESLERREMMAANLAADMGVAFETNTDDITLPTAVNAPVDTNESGSVASDAVPNVDASPVLDKTLPAVRQIAAGGSEKTMKEKLEDDGYKCGRGGLGSIYCTKEGKPSYVCDNSGKCAEMPRKQTDGQDRVVGDVLSDEIVKELDIRRLPSFPGDLNFDLKVDDKDIDLLSFELRTTTPNPALDLTGDGHLTPADKDELIENILGTTYGDSNLDRIFNSSDMVKVFQFGKYEDAIDGNSRWAEGDWNGDGDFGSADLVLAFEQGDF